MTDLDTLGYVASGTALIPALGFLVAWDHNEDFGVHCRRQIASVGRGLWPLVGTPLYLVMVLAGILAYLGAHTVAMVAGLAGLLVCLWNESWSGAAFALRDRAHYYLRIKRAHIPAH